MFITWRHGKFSRIVCIFKSRARGGNIDAGQLDVTRIRCRLACQEFLRELQLVLAILFRGQAFSILNELPPKRLESVYDYATIDVVLLAREIPSSFLSIILTLSSNYCSIFARSRERIEDYYYYYENNKDRSEVKL